MTFEDYVQHQQQTLLRFATVLIGDGGVAEDVVQEVLARALQRWPQVQRADHPHAYVRRMVVNEYLSWRRRWQRVQPSADLEWLAPPMPDHAVRHAERVALLQQLGTLPRRQRAAVVLRYYEDLSDSEIAAVLGCGASTVRSNISRALRTLRVELAEPAALERRSQPVSTTTEDS